MGETNRAAHWTSPERNHIKSTFPSMMEHFMSNDQLSKHLGKQMSIQTVRYREPESEIKPVETEMNRMKRKNSKLKKQQSHHGMILEVPDPKHVQSVQLNADQDIPEDEEQQNLAKIKQQEHDSLVQSLMQLRDYYKSEYKKALQEKVQHQKKLMFERQSKLEEERKRSEEQQRDLSHRIAHKLPRSVLVKDADSKSSVQTFYYKIISLENKLKREGLLNKNHEVTAFWDFITAPGNLENVMEDGQISWELIKKHQKSNDKTLLPAHREKVDTSPYTGSVKNRNPRKGGASTWRRTTHGIRTLLTPSSLSDIPSSGCQSSSPLASSKARTKKTQVSSAVSIEQKFPKVEFPPLAAYRLEFGKPEPSAEEVRKFEEAKRRLQERNGLKTTLNTMFSHALANRAATQRLMDRNEDYNFESLSGAAIIDEFHNLTSKPLSADSAKKRSQDSRPKSSTVTGKISRPMSRKNSMNRKESVKATPDSGSQDVSETNSLCSFHQDLVVELPPLTIDKLSESCVVKEAQRLSTLWINPA